MSIVTFAEKEIAANEYDKVFCVFDRNGHTNYQAAMARIENSADGRTGKIQAITSWPCFELWFLLHFRYSAAPFERTGSESSCDLVIRELLRFFPGYTKGHQAIFDALASKMPDALKNAKRLHTYNESCGSTNPSTKIHTLVEYLIGIKRSMADELKEAVERMHGGTATFVESVAVMETFQGKTAWEGVVHVFDVAGNELATRAYAWSTEEPGKNRVIAVLHVPPVDSPEKAVRAAIVHDYRRSGKAV